MIINYNIKNDVTQQELMGANTREYAFRCQNSNAPRKMAAHNSKTIEVFAYLFFVKAREMGVITSWTWDDEVTCVWVSPSLK